MFGDPVLNPKGLTLKPMTEVFDIITGKLDSNAAVEHGAYPFFTCAKQPTLIDEYAFDMEALLLAGNNANADYDVKHYSGKFNAYQRTYILTLKDEQNLYPFYRFALEYQLENLKRFSKGSNTKYITLGIMERTFLPVPGIRKQQEFVASWDQLNLAVKKVQISGEMCDQLFNSLSQEKFGS